MYFSNSPYRMGSSKLVFEIHYSVGSMGTLVVSIWVMKLQFIMRVMIVMSCHILS
jgi:hypothetical protein